jgi:hypothetical protein
VCRVGRHPMRTHRIAFPRRRLCRNRDGVAGKRWPHVAIRVLSRARAFCVRALPHRATVVAALRQQAQTLRGRRQGVRRACAPFDPWNTAHANSSDHRACTRTSRRRVQPQDFAQIAHACRAFVARRLRWQRACAIADRIFCQRECVAVASTGLRGTRYAALDALGTVGERTAGTSRKATTAPNATATPFL